MQIAESSGGRYLLAILGKGWSWLFLLALVLFFSISGQGFFSFTNLQNVLTDTTFALLVALGQTFVVIGGGIDLSTAYVMGLACVVAALTVGLLGTLPLLLLALLVLLAGLAAGLIVGLLNGYFIAYLKIPAFVVTLGTYGIARGIGFILAHGEPVSAQNSGIEALGNGYLLYLLPDFRIRFFTLPPGLSSVQLRHTIGILPFQLIVSIVLTLFCTWLLARTRFGVHTYAIGGNREAALRAGIPVARHTAKLYLLSAALAAVAGVLYLFRFSNGAADAGDPLLLDSIAAVAIGGTSLFGGEGTIAGTLIGALIIAVIQNGLVILGVDPLWQFVTIGTVIILAVLIDQLKARIHL
jgi:ribose/xylose/arabinose/galactoside ABC-type transport system permease subunit